MSAAAAFTHYNSSPRTVYRAILRELRKSAPPADTGASISLKTAGSSADLIASAQSKLAARSAPTPASPTPSSAPVDAPETTISRPRLPGFLQSPVLPFIRQALRSAAADSSTGVQGRTPLRDLADVELFMRSKRIHADLLVRYNPTHGMSEQERVRATARMVGLDVPVEYDPSNSDADAGVMAAATLQGDSQGQSKGYTGPLPPPKLDQD
ncbi:unnamed protein product [Tilletia controversa]|nr:unnamed protein product [Tilletia controversa]CAD6956215.1 unnamed protein product [Tilletia controversa]CAD6968321.1 unnamed protein product [Tilletia controversa]CAD6984407.1 unnamed protein product [Tilletia controversa]